MRRLLSCAGLLFIGLAAHGEIREWSDAQTGYSIFGDYVTITAPGTYKFESITGGVLDDINAITIADGVAGWVHLTVQRNPSDPNAPNTVKGATELKLVQNLSATAGLIIEILDLDSHLAREGPLVAARVEGYIDCRAIMNDLTLERLEGEIRCGRLANLTIGGEAVEEEPAPVRGAVVVYGDQPPYTGVLYSAQSLDTVWFDCDFAGQASIRGTLLQLVIEGALTGSVDVRDELGSVDIHKDLQGSLSVGGNLGAFGTPSFVAGGVSGELNVVGDLVLGRLEVRTGAVPAGGQINLGGIGQATLWVSGPLDGTVNVGGDVTGEIRTFNIQQTGNIVIDGNLAGVVDVLGQLYDVAGDTSGGHIIVNGSLDGHIRIGGPFVGGTEFVAIDYDGFDADDVWGPYAYVFVDGTHCYDNTPAARVWKITECRGDMNNDGVVNPVDIPCFVDALLDPEVRYRIKLPGLYGSMVWHGSCDCDDDLDFQDIASLVDRIVFPGGCCDPGCPGCEQGDGPSAKPTPKEVAELLAGNVDAATYDGLVNVVANAAAAYGDSELGEYWTSVYEYLAE